MVILSNWQQKSTVFFFSLHFYKRYDHFITAIIIPLVQVAIYLSNQALLI
jgi:hypothetical protein